MVLVLIHHTQDAHRRLVRTTKGLQQLVVLSADLLPHLASSFDQFVLHQRRVVIVRLEVDLAVRRQAHQAGLLGLLLPGGAEVAKDLAVFGLRPVLAAACGATVSLCGAVSVQIQSAVVGHYSLESETMSC